MFRFFSKSVASIAQLQAWFVLHMRTSDFQVFIPPATINSPSMARVA